MKTHSAIMNSRVTGSNSLKPCQKGVLQNTKALMLMYQHLRTTTDVKYIMTNNLNQDNLERLFGYMRCQGGGLNDHPSPLQFMHRLRKAMLGRSDETQRLSCSNIQKNPTSNEWLKIKTGMTAAIRPMPSGKITNETGSY